VFSTTPDDSKHNVPTSDYRREDPTMSIHGQQTLSGRKELRKAGMVIRYPNLDPVLYYRVTFGSSNRTGNLDMTPSREVLF
jgi:hypothetical protein